ncbi:MAG: sulfotransferase domain-containing protein [Alphaproteobacteria bacterium]|jgi:hypothetical protein|nr:sulfotransferase domain-containing protein [Alphaproteobacteria bacterium]MBT4016584.1 sulfotransferase domain-containing protein [Alphaproteobacteria bacterium]MBT4966600.1 sulfotransferase domain-containing protein [Alphaproteobacteria bacterium]MBT5917696.1 sulfotransferase domain-containing protein [Alphaproteobacteria bacterium]
MSGILWLASYPKSGNTWIRIFLANLISNAKNADAIKNIKYFNFSDVHAHLFQNVASSPVEGMSVEDIAALRPTMHRSLAQSGQNTVFVKTHSCLTEFGGHDQITMDVTSGAIYILRNPLDVCLSMAPHFGISVDEAIEWLNDYSFVAGDDGGEVPYLIGAWSRHVESWTQAGSSSTLHIVRYEDMTYKPGPTFKGIAKFMGLKPPAEALKRAIKLSSFDNVRSQEDRSGFEERSVHADKFFRVGKANQWKSVLSKEQIDKVVEGNYDMMKKFNYLPPEYK